MRLLIAMMLFFPGCVARSAVVVPSTQHVELASIPRPVRPVQEPEPLAPPAPPDLPSVVSTADSVHQVAIEYHHIEERLVGAVSSENVTPQYIRNVQKADTAARRKLAIIEAANGHPSRQSVEEARDAVGHLGDVLAQPPDQAEP